MDKHAKKVKARSLEELDPQEVPPHLSPTFHSPFATPTQIEDSLPYHELRKIGLERLCYLLLLAQDKVPRYFGVNGQAQFGIDLLVVEGHQTRVYQCKNEAEFPRLEMEKALDKFEVEWLGRPKLPRPAEFVLCCPLPLQERKQNEEWTILERAFYKRTGVSATFWDRNYLDERLRKLPDIVADLFSDLAAQLFCDRYEWKAGIFRPLVAGSGQRVIDSYIEKRESGRLYIDPCYEEQFSRMLDEGETLLIRGLPGTGKTMTGLALAENFSNRQCRVIFINLRYEIDEESLIQGVQDRLTRPTIFFFDDCYGKYSLLDRVYTRLRRNLVDRPGRGLLVFTARTTPTPESVPRADNSEFEDELARNKAILEFQSTSSQYREIIIQAKPDFKGLSEVRLEKVFELTGHDLFLLDRLLQTLDSPYEIDQLTPERLFADTLRRYFGADTVHRPGFLKLAALAQFDLAVPVASFEFKLDREDPKAYLQLLVEADRPPSYYFLHSSAAELVFRALAWNGGNDDHIALAAQYLTDFFNGLTSGHKRLASDLASAIHNRLKLTEDRAEENRLKTLLLTNDGIYSLIEGVSDRLPLISLADCLVILDGTDEVTHRRYQDLVQKMINEGIVLRMVIERPFWESRFFLRLVRRAYPVLLSCLRTQLVDRELRSLARTTYLQNFLALLSELSNPNDLGWASSFGSDWTKELEEMIRRTIDSGHSIGTISLSLKELGETNPDVLKELERKIGAKRYLYLVSKAGTIPELFGIIRYSSSSMAGELVEAIDDETLDALIARTVDSGRSIGTVNLSLRELGETNHDLSDRLIRKIGTKRWWTLLCTRGSPLIVSQVLKNMDRSFKQLMVQRGRDVSHGQWQALLLRGDFVQLCNVARWSHRFFHRLFRSDTLDYLRPTFETLVRRSDWSTLSRGVELLMTATDSSIRQSLVNALRDCIAEANPRSMHFESFDDATACATVLWYALPGRREELYGSLSIMLPRNDSWRKNDTFLHSAQRLLLILADPQAQPDVARYVLCVCNDPAVIPLVREVATNEFLFYLWGLYAVWFQWARRPNTDFSDFLHSTIRNTMIDVWAERIRAEDNPAETDNLIALAGFMSLSGSHLNLSKEVRLLPNWPPLKDLLKRAPSKDFIPEVLFLLGLEFIYDRRDAIPPRIWRRSITKAGQYTLKTAAMEDLYNMVRFRARGSPHLP